jgi:hypothetical protein
MTAEMYLETMLALVSYMLNTVVDSASLLVISIEDWKARTEESIRGHGDQLLGAEGTFRWLERFERFERLEKVERLERGWPLPAGHLKLFKKERGWLM